MSMTVISLREDNMDTLIGRRVQNLMWDYKIKATGLARATGLEATGLSRRLRGERGWSPDDIAVLAYVFNVSVAFLFGEVDALRPLPAQMKVALEKRFPRATPLPDLDSNQEPIG